MFKDFVIKLPKDEEGRERLKYIEQAQNAVAEKFPEVLPVKRVPRIALIMDRAPGEKISTIAKDEISKGNWRAEIRKLMAAIKEKTGYDIKDPALQNFFYKKETGQIYPIDFSSVEGRN